MSQRCRAAPVANCSGHTPTSTVITASLLVLAISPRDSTGAIIAAAAVEKAEGPPLADVQTWAQNELER
jgi:hypothetical protein